jgi:hypothetical protein
MTFFDTASGRISIKVSSWGLLLPRLPFAIHAKAAQELKPNGLSDELPTYSGSVHQPEPLNEQAHVSVPRLNLPTHRAFRQAQFLQ